MACEKCSDRGYLLTDGRNFTGFCDCAKGVEVSHAMWEKQQTLAGIPREYFAKELAHLYPQVNILHKDLVARTARNVENIESVYNTSSVWAIHGDSGTGKSLAGVLVLKAAIRHGYSSRYITWTDLLDGRLNPEEGETKLITKLRNVDFLVMDEVGEDSMKYESKFPNETLEKVIKDRYSNQKPSILVLSDDFSAVSKRLPILTDLVGPSAISEVRGLNYRLNRK